MGLDMYLDSTKRTDHSIAELEELDSYEINPQKPEAAPFLPLRKYEYLEDTYTIFHEVAYWRKFNALHNWFVQKVQDGVDECQKSEINQETLLELLKDLNSVLSGESVGELEPVSGFFFGSTEKDDWFFQKMRDTKELFEELVRCFDFENHRLFYQASW